MKIRTLLLCTVALACGLVSQGQAAVVNWTIDSNQSWIRLSVPDQVINIGGGNTLPAYLRNQTANPGDPVAGSWTDSGKRLASVSGVIASNMTSNSITFASGTHAAPAAATGNWRPDAASWDGSTFNTANGAVSPSVFAADLTHTGAFKIAFLNFYNVNTDYAGTATGLSSYAGTGAGTLAVGALGTILDLDALFLITDSRTNLGALVGNSNLGVNGSLNIVNTGGLNREMVITHTVPFVTFINGLPVNASFQSRILATATVPEPASLSLLGLAVSACALRRRRKV
ncbi:MAG: PEP-CTERM sorting domain-containing protein [Pirellulaceae bacterium]|nr:PEP-CTERM sorting domain-containing protein [Pirellulaceae bacterium]